uniref:alkylated DNA repair protein alkB homolog 8-like n=1 Tax=Styela clava TaxID=7725 RepID=UPI0019398C0F|nr:alkylated DNA repair protein alkB homolog 8-like [Styela clava]
MIENSAKYSTRFRKKLVKARTKLNKEGLTFSDSPTLYIVISNGGLANGVQRSNLEEIITSFKELIMLPQKSYAMVSFENTKNSQATFEKLQGHVLKSTLNLASPNPILYLHYVNDLNPQKSGDFQSPRWDNVPGLIILEDFITETKQIELLKFLEADSPVSNGLDCSDNILKHRKVWHYGYEFRYKHNDVDPNLPLEKGIPKILKSVISKMKETGHIVKEPNQITINKYEPGQGIPSHIDNPEAFDDTLASLSLNSQTVMDFKNSKTKEHNQVLLKERSLMIFTGESRYKWTHGICPRKVDLIPVNKDDADKLTSLNRGMRMSVTFRRVREDYKGPSQNPDIDRPVNEIEAATLEEEHVHKVYNEIASHFTSTRDKPWPKVKQFINELEAHSTIIDIGCGSGRYLGVRSDVYMIGCDRSQNLINICKEKGFKVFTCDGLNLSLRHGIFDACICIAVIHHYSTHERRMKAIEQLLQLVRVEGQILISVWAMEQEYKRVKSKYLKRIDNGPTEKEIPVVPESASKHTIQNLDKSVEIQKSANNPAPPEDSHASNTAAMNDLSIKDKQQSILPVHKNRTPFEKQDVLVPWHRKTVQVSKQKSDQECLKTPELSEDEKIKSEIVNQSSNDNSKLFHRYYHVFKQGELEELCESFDNVEVITSYYDEGNWCVILKKL